MVNKMHIYTVHRRCLLKREILRNRLALAPMAPHVISSLIKDQMGFVGKVADEVLHVLKCQPRLVTVRRTDVCYNELPVSADNETSFVTGNKDFAAARRANRMQLSYPLSVLYR